MSRIIRRGNGVVDPLSGMEDKGTILQESDGTVWSVMLNQTDLTYGIKGHNKFYMIQVIIDNKESHKAFVFFKWGRVGAKTPQRKLHGPLTLHAAKELFTTKFTAKTENEWPLQGAFEPVKGKYSLIELDYSDDVDEIPSKPEVKREIPPSKLQPSIQKFIQTICNVDLITQEVAEMHLDLNRMPLGKLSKAQIAKGYEILSTISDTLKELSELQNFNNDETLESPVKPTTRRRSSRVKKPVRITNAISKCKTKLKEFTGDFYTLIPYDSGMNLPPVIDSMSELKLKLDLLEVLSDIEITQKLIKSENQIIDINPTDAHYKALGIELDELAPTSKDYHLIEQYIQTTHAPTHRQYTLQVEAIHKIHRPSDDVKNSLFDTIENHQLLWHGSRLSNIASILTKGLRIAPPEAPSTGYMFGKGIYFADVASKSANYCWANAKQTKGVLILSEVALGKSALILEAKEFTYESIKARTCDSLLGLGRMRPNKDSHHTTENGVCIPMGELKPTDAEGTLLYNEYVVYHTEQVKMRYAVSVNFQFK